MLTRIFRSFNFSSLCEPNCKLFVIQRSCFRSSRIKRNNILDNISSIPGNTNKLFEGLVHGDRSSLASAITLVESQHPKKREESQTLLTLALKKAEERYKCEGQKSLSFRIGLTGPPGVGKSTFIEAFGKLLTNKGNKVAVLTVDPSSTTTGGSILGDKTRMTELSRDSLAYIRPSPSSGCLGGVTRSTNEAIILCECAGYNTVIIETVGVGQSEVDVADMVDMFVLLVPPAGGDELQALKKGVVELVDMIVVNKADGNLLPNARRIQAEYLSALKFIRQRSKLYKPQVLRVSSVTKEGISEMWEEMCNFRDINSTSGDLEHKRRNQYKAWMWKHIRHSLLSTFKNHPTVKKFISDTESAVEDRIITSGEAAEYLMKKFLTCYACGAVV